MESKEEIPSEILDVIRTRSDLIELGFDKVENERKLITWLLNHGITEYPNLFKGNKNSSNFLNWLSQKSSSLKYKNLSRIVLYIWDNNSMHRKRWPNPEKNDLYIYWLYRNWNKINTINQNIKRIFNYYYPFNILYTVCNLIQFIKWYINKKTIFRYKINSYINNNNKSVKRFFYGLNSQRNVIDALVYRELKTRISQVRFGFLGVFIEPLGVMAVFLIIFSILRGGRAGSLDIFLFLGSGIVYYTVFSDIAIRSANAMIANEALFFYRPVKPIDTVIARAIVETGLYAIVFICIIIGTFLKTESWILQDILLLFSSYIALAIYSLGIGIFLMVSCHIYPSILQFIPFIMRPLWFISGVFISLSQVPQWLRPYLSWNPVFQAIELARHAFSTNYIIRTDEVSLLYLWECAIISLTIGLCVYSTNERRLLTK